MEVIKLMEKLSYTIGGNDSINHKIGTSGQFGGLYNLDTQNMGSLRSSIAL
jgi:hypothetical protein